MHRKYCLILLMMFLEVNTLHADKLLINNKKSLATPTPLNNLQASASLKVVTSNGSDRAIVASNDLFNITNSQNRGDTAAVDENELAVTVNGLPSATVDVRFVNNQGEVQTEIVWDNDVDSTTAVSNMISTNGIATLMLDSETGSFTIYARNVNMGNAGSLETGFKVQASLTDFRTSVSSSENITIDRQQPTCIDARAIDHYHLEFALSEAVQQSQLFNIAEDNADGNNNSDTVNLDTHITLIGDNSEATLSEFNNSPVSFNSESTTLNINTAQLLSSTSNIAVLDSAVMDMTGNMAGGTSARCPSFTTLDTNVPVIVNESIQVSDINPGCFRIGSNDVIDFIVSADINQAIEARFVNLDSGDIIDHTEFTIFETIPGTYSASLGLGNTSWAEGNRLGIEVTVDGFVQSILTGINEYIIDNTGPLLLAAEPQGGRASILTFSENVINDEDLLNEENYLVEGVAATSVTVLTETAILITHGLHIEDSTLTVNINTSNDGSEAQLGLVSTVQPALNIAETSLTLSVGTTTSLTIADGVADSYISSDATIASVNSDGVVTAICDGSTTITVTDIYGHADTVTVNVYTTQEVSLPVGTISDNTTTAYFSACASRDNGQHCENIFSATDSISIWGDIWPEIQHVGSQGSLYSIITFSGWTFYKNVQGGYTLMGDYNKPDYNALQAYDTAVELTEHIHIDLFENIVPGGMNLDGLNYSVFFGYSLDSSPEEIYFNMEALSFSVH